MKSLLTGLAIIGLFAACSSKTKTAETTSTTPAVTTTAAAPTAATTTTATTAKTEKKTKADKKAKSAAKAATTETAAATTKAEGKVTCTTGKETRTLEVKKADGKACEVIYTKAGEAKSIASAIADTAHCEAVTQKVSKNLEAAGYKCE